MKSKNIKSLILAMAVFFGTVFALSPVAEATLYDGTHWSQCSGRSTMHYRAWGKARMWVYRCTNGYVFTHVSSTTKAQKNVSSWRKVPYGFESTYSYSYGATTNMIAVVKGSCYVMWGKSDDSGAGQTIKFCM